MEVGAIAASTASPPTMKKGNANTRGIDSLCCTVEKLCTKVAKLEATRNVKANPRPKSTPRSFN